MKIHKATICGLNKGRETKVHKIFKGMFINP